MRIVLLLVLFEIIEIASFEKRPVIENYVIATCYGKTPCNACKNFSACKHCHVNKGKLVFVENGRYKE